MADYGTFTVRPASKTTGTDLQDALKVSISPTILLLRGIQPGQICDISARGVRVPVSVWPATEKLQDTVIQIPKTFQHLQGLKLGDRITLSPSAGGVTRATEIVLHESPKADPSPLTDTILDSDWDHWAWALQPILTDVELLAPGLTVEVAQTGRSKRNFTIHEVNGSRSYGLWKATVETAVRISRAPDALRHTDDQAKSAQYALEIPTYGMGGLDLQLSRLQSEIAAYRASEEEKESLVCFRRRAGAILLHGPTGTGKSLLLDKVSKAGWRTVKRLDKSLTASKAGDSTAMLRKTFQEAKASQPSLIVIDNLEAWADNKDSSNSLGTDAISDALSDEIEQLDDCATLVLAATQSLNAVNQRLRSFDRFSLELEVPVPSSKLRLEIMKALSGIPTNQHHAELEFLASRTHGFVASDLGSLLRTAVRSARSRLDASSHSTTKLNDQRSNSVQLREVPFVHDDFLSALQQVHPTAIREIFVEITEVKWSDIAGQDEAKKELERALIWPSKFPNEMRYYGIKPSKGLLLFGPPGCSKTMMARAAATESGHNFLSVKGPELVNMYLGETERAIRELFAKARSVSPSIIFFDEIDAIGGSRGKSQHSGLNAVTTLLSEIDGIVELNGVFVLGATNRPETLDPALLRAGRLGTVLYVKPPDFTERQQILEKNLKSIATGPEVSFQRLAEETDGFSGKELVRLCEKAGEAAFVEEGFRSQGAVESRHFEAAFTGIRKTITNEMLDAFREFALN